MGIYWESFEYTAWCFHSQVSGCQGRGVSMTTPQVRAAHFAVFQCKTSFVSLQCSLKAPERSCQRDVRGVCVCVCVCVSHSDWESVMSVHGGGWDGGWVSQRRGEWREVPRRALIPGIIDFKPPLWYRSDAAARYCTNTLKLCSETTPVSAVKGAVWHFYQREEF